jgi:hypothetical protein
MEGGAMERSGYLLLADISGYTEFVTRTEIDHGNEVLASLIGTVVGETKKPFRVQEVEGDAVFSCAFADDVARGEIVLDLVESVYTAFRRALEGIQRDSSCQCRACATAGDLDLKFVLHYGALAGRDIAGHTGFGGPAVILAHRMLKNRVAEATGCKAYAFLSAAAVEALGVAGVTDGMTAHGETYEHLGRVDGHVYDLTAYWDRTSAERTVTVPEAGASFATTLVVPGSPLLAWQVYTDPRQRQVWLHADSLRVEGLRGGRFGPGTLEHCAHGKAMFTHKTLDWQPVRYVTRAILLPLGGLLPYMARFEEVAEGTRVAVVFGKPTHDNRLVQALLRVMLAPQGFKARKELRVNFAKYAEMVAELAAAQSDAGPADRTVTA